MYFNLQQGLNYVSQYFQCCGGFTPSTSQFSMQDFVVLRWHAAAKCCLKVLKILEKANFLSSLKFKFSPKPLVIVANFLIISKLKTFLAATRGFAAVCF